MPGFLKNIEMVLNLMSLPVLFLFHSFVSCRFGNPWKLTAFAALAVALLHGTLGWLVRRRQRAVRNEILGRIYGTLAGAKNIDNAEGLAERMRLALAQLPALRSEPLALSAEGDARVLTA